MQILQFHYNLMFFVLNYNILQPGSVSQNIEAETSENVANSSNKNIS